MSKAIDLFKVGRIIESCQTQDQVTMALGIVKRYIAKYHGQVASLEQHRQFLEESNLLYRLISKKRDSATFTMKRGESLR
jgi:hypothetical protein